VRFFRTLARGQSEATPARALGSVVAVVGLVVVVVAGIALVVYAVV
jgi:hypothetical protein